MSWSSSLFVAVLSGVLSLLVAGLVTATLSQWLEVSNREGAAGYLMIFMALIGGAVGVGIGLGASRVVAGMAEPGFLKALGISCGVVLALGGIALLIGWLRADFAPEIDGKSLELAIEVRCPKDFKLPTTKDEYGIYACIRVPGSRSYQSRGEPDLAHATQQDGRWIVTAVVPLQTSASWKVMDVRFSKDGATTFSLPLPRHPNRSHMEWSEWVDSAWDAGKPEPSPEKKFNLRYKVQLVEPPPPTLDPADVRAQEFAALNPDAPLEEWLPFLFEEPNAERTKVVIEHINAQQPELAQLLRSPDEQMRERAFSAADYVEKPAPEVVEAVLAEGRDIAEGIREFNKLPEDDPNFHDVLLALRTRFNYWKQAWWVMHQRLGVDGRPPVQEIYDLTSVRARGTAMSEIEVNARVILDALNKKPEEKKP